MSHPMTPKEGMAVPEGFRLPHNTTRTMADVWADDTRAKLAAAGKRGGEAKARNRIVREKLLPPPVTPRGKIAYAGYDVSEVQVKRHAK